MHFVRHISYIHAYIHAYVHTNLRCNTGHCKHTGEKVAIKTIRKIFWNATHAKRILREIRILRVLKNHASIIGIKGKSDFCSAHSQGMTSYRANEGRGDGGGRARRSELMFLPRTRTYAGTRTQTLLFIDTLNEIYEFMYTLVLILCVHAGIIPPKNADSFDKLYIVFEYGASDLAKLVRHQEYLSTMHIQYLLYQLLCGVLFMHTHNIIHRDLKPANIIINADCSLKVRVCERSAWCM